MKERTRKTGIDVIGNAPWGTHFCQFYQNKKDLINILVPYFKAGLKNNEFCMWVTSEPLNEKEARQAMGKSLPDFNRYLEKGQIKIIPYSQWYVEEGSFSSRRVLRGWVDELKQALSKGYDGLRLSGNTFWLEKRDWKSFTGYEEEMSKVIGKYRMLAICTYSLDKCGASEIMDVVSNHQFPLIRKAGKWRLIESSGLKIAKEELKESKKRYRFLFNNMLSGFAYCKILVDEDNKPVDFIYLDVNDAFEKQTGLRKEDVIDKRATEAIPGIKDSHPELFDIYGKVASTGKPTKFDILFKPLEIWLTISVYSPEKDYFVAVFDNVTDRRRAEEEKEKSLQKLKLSEKNLREFSRNILSAREEEKKKLAANLHDEVGSLAVNLASGLTIVEHEIKSNNLQDALENLHEVKRAVKKQARALKKIATEIRPPDLDIIGLPEALRTHFLHIAKETKIKIDFRTSVKKRINDDVAIALYRIAQESFINIITYAKAKKVKVRLYLQNGTIKLNIGDDGRGFDVEKTLNKFGLQGMGIRGMQERTESLKGKFVVRSSPGEGTEIMVTLPITGKQTGRNRKPRTKDKS